MAEKNDFVIFLFTLMTSKKTFLQTATLIEDILGVKKVSYVFQQMGDLMGEGVSDNWILRPE